MNKYLHYIDGRYRTKERKISLVSRVLATPVFYSRILPVIFSASRVAKRGEYTTQRWASDSDAMRRHLESVGVIIDIEGAENLESANYPVVFVSNHMSTVETFVLPSMLTPYSEVTFVVKKSLVEMPVFGPIMRSRGPITVGRKNPREDLKAVLEEGTEIIRSGISIVIFPQSPEAGTTRMTGFEPARFNSIGIKLAKKAGVPVIPIALKTDAWGTNRYFMKDLGKVYPNKQVFFSIGRQTEITGRGNEQHEAIVDFISSKLRLWEHENPA